MNDISFERIINTISLFYYQEEVFMLEKKRATELGIAGAIIGILAVLSVKMGNPGNMGICIACFIRDCFSRRISQRSASKALLYLRACLSSSIS